MSQDVHDCDYWGASEGLELVSGHAVDLTYPPAPGPPPPPGVSERQVRVALAKPRASMRYRIER